MMDRPPGGHSYRLHGGKIDCLAAFSLVAAINLSVKRYSRFCFDRYDRHNHSADPVTITGFLFGTT